MNRNIDPRDIVALQRHQAEEESKAKLVQDQQADDLRWLMAHAQGRRIMARLLALSGTERGSFTGNSTTFFNEGQRSVGLVFENEVKAIAFDHYIAMLKEQRK